MTIFGGRSSPIRKYPDKKSRYRKKQNRIYYPRLLIFSFIFILILALAGCAQEAGPCPSYPYADLSAVDGFADDATLPFRFPLDDFSHDISPSSTNFCTASSGPVSARMYHAAEDYFMPAGTPVYAIADGEVSYSGTMGGYGWLIIIDHPQANFYSLYGHLSPSRWRMEPGSVEKGTMIGYLGDEHENGGSVKQPLEPHLHLGLRAGQRGSYPARGEWRWMAGWIKPCPTDLGWLHPSAVITSQGIPLGGFAEPASGFLARWGVELLFTSIYVIGGLCMFVYATRKIKPYLLVFSGGFLCIAGWVFYNDRWRMSYAILVMAVLFLAIGIYRLIGRPTEQKPS